MSDPKPEHLLFRSLPKWLQLLVTGAPVSPEQAKEIIRRTDRCFTSSAGGGNNREYNRWARTLLGMPPDLLDSPGREVSLEDRQRWRVAFNAAWEAFEARWQPIKTDYVHNDWVSCCFVGGPHGWCHPDGQIGFVDNVGKWPSVEQVLTDWQVLAEAFPFLNLAATLRSGEACEEETTAVVSIVVRGGRAELVDPAKLDVHAGHAPATRRAGEEKPWVEILGDPRREQGLPDEWIEGWARAFGPCAAR